MVENQDSNGEEDGIDILPINPIEEKDRQIVDLKKALDESRMQVSEVSAIKECLLKTRHELKAEKHFSLLRSRKIDFAQKVTEQRMSNSLSSLSGDLEEELVSLYSTLVDEDSFQVEDGQILPGENFLKSVEEKLAERGDDPHEVQCLDQVRNKILERVKQKKAHRQVRRDSISSMSSISSKRGNSDLVGGDSSRAKVDLPSVVPAKPL